MAASAEQAISAANERLKTAQLGLETMRSRKSQFQSGLMNAVVFGRMVTFSLQNMKGVVPGWEEWYAAEVEQMKADPLLKYMIDLRNKLEKQTSTGAVLSGCIRHFSHETMRQLGPPPAGATSFVMGSARHGGASGWMVPADDGSEELYVVNVPASVGTFMTLLPEAPGSWSGRPVEELVEAYLDRMARLVRDARTKFV